MASWSEAMMLNARQVPTVLPTRPKVDCTPLKMACVMRSSICVACMVAPKTMAHRMSQMVFSIPAIPLEESNALAMSLEVEMALSNAVDWMHALNAAKA